MRPLVSRSNASARPSFGASPQAGEALGARRESSRGLPNQGPSARFLTVVTLTDLRLTVFATTSCHVVARLPGTPIRGLLRFAELLAFKSIVPKFTVGALYGDLMSTGSMATSVGPEASGRADNRLRRGILLVAILTIGASVAIAAIEITPVLFDSHDTEPSDFAPVGIEKLAPGRVGCASTQGEVCYLALFDSALAGLTWSHIRFAVANSSTSTTNGPEAPPIPLGPGARVSVLAASGGISGVWNWTLAEWISGSSLGVPTNANSTVVLDTDLLSNRTLQSAEFAIILTSPFEGAIGLPLYCEGC